MRWNASTWPDRLAARAWSAAICSGAARRDAAAEAEGGATARAEQVRDAARRVGASGDREQLRAIARPPGRREERRCGDLRRRAVEAAYPDRRRLAETAGTGPLHRRVAV